MAAPRPSASLIIAVPEPHVGPAAAEVAYSVLMMKRHQSSTSFASAHVFPGGVMDPVDVELAGRCGLPPGGPLVGALALKLCAVRETFEETGLLLLQHKFTREELRAWRAKLRADHKGGGLNAGFAGAQLECT